MKKIVAVITCFNLIFSLIYPIFVLARETEDDPNANPNAECQTKFLYPECDWNSHQVYDVYQNTCTGDYSKENNRYQDGQCGYSSQPNFDASPQCQEGEVIDWCAKKECDPNIDNGRLVCFKEVKKADCSISLEVNNATEEKCGAALTAQILLDSGGNDPVSYYGGAIPATVEPSEVAPEEAAPTPTPQPPIFNTWDLGYSTQWDPTPEPAPAPIPAIIITSPTAQERALERYEKRAEAMDQYQDEVMANTRADESTSGNEVIYLPSKITGMVQNQIDKVEEGLNKIAESTTPKTREEVLQEERLARKEEQLNKLAQQQDAAVEADQKKQRDAIVAVQNMPADQRAAYLKDQGVIPQDIPTDQIDAKVRAAAVKSGLQIDGNITSGDFTISVGSATISAADIVNAGNAAGEFGLDTAMQGTYYLGKSALNLQGDMDKVDRLLGETGLASRQQLSPISGPGSLAGGYAVTLIRLQELKNDVDAYPDSTLTPEQQAKRKEYAEALRTLWEQQHQIAIDTAAAAAMTFVGAPLKIAKAGAAKVIPQSVQKAAGETGSSAWSWVSSKVGGLLGRGVKEGEEAVGGVAGSVFIKTEGKTTGSVAVKNLEVTERLRLNMEDAKEMYSDQDIDEARSLAQEVLGFTPSDDTIAIVVDALKGDKASREAIKERLSRVKSIVSHQEILLGSEGDNTTGRILVKAPPGTNDNVFTDDSERIVGVEDTWNTFRYNGESFLAVPIIRGRINRYCNIAKLI
ncbi:hypothetical protein HYU93_00195 [Candidatus Daviesbacteria bacterium]|nr:hypothetical protein [Candidatus Daviesbacteria bacterium]